MEQTTYQEYVRSITTVIPNDMFAAFFMQAYYDKVYKLDVAEGVVRQAYGNLKTVVDDFEEAYKAASFLGIKNFGPGNAFIINKDLNDSSKSITMKMAKEFIVKMRKMLAEDPEQTHFGLIFLAGRGMINQGIQTIMLNDYNEKSEFYHLYKIEEHVRTLTNNYKNSYLVAIIACCREIFDPQRHSGMIGALSVNEAERLFYEKEKEQLDQEEDTKQKEIKILQKQIISLINKLDEAYGRGGRGGEQENTNYEETKQEAQKKMIDLVDKQEFQNFMLIFGAKPGGSVDADTKIIKDTMSTFMQQYDRETLILEFPRILQNLKGSDAKVEIIQSAMLRPIRLSVKGNQPVDPKAYIFVQSKLQRDDLPPLEYINAKARADATFRFFHDVLQFKPENIFVYEDYSKAQIKQVFDKLNEEAKAFEDDQMKGPGDVNAVYITWVGFCLNPQFHPFMVDNESPIKSVNRTDYMSKYKSDRKMMMSAHKYQTKSINKSEIKSLKKTYSRLSEMSFTEFPNNSGSKYSETKLKYSKDITMEFFSLTKSGEAINISEFALILCKQSKTQVVLFQDNQQSTQCLPDDIAYIDQDAEFDDYVFGSRKDTASNPAWSSFHYFLSSDMANNILPIFLEQVSKGQQVFMMPEAVQKIELYQTFSDVQPKIMFHDLRNQEHQQSDQLGISSTTLDKKMNLFATRPEIVACVEMGQPTEPSLWHSEALELFIMVYRYPKNKQETQIKIYADEAPYRLRLDKVLKFNTYWATHSLDRRSISEQKTKKQLYFGLNDFDETNEQQSILIRLVLQDDNTSKEMPSDFIKEHMYRCHTLPNSKVLAFHIYRLIVYTEDLISLKKIKWSDQLGFPMKQLCNFGIATSLISQEQTQLICSFELDPADIQNIATNFIYDKCYAKAKDFYGEAFIVLRLKLKDEKLCFEVENQDKQSIIFKHEEPSYLIEFAINELLVTGYPSHLYIVKQWQSVQVLLDPNTANFKYYVSPLPGFDEKRFPFLALCGQQNISILNINTLVQKPIVNQKSTWSAGLQNILIKKDQFGMSLHYASTMKDKDGSGQDLIHYSYINIKDDLLNWLRENGRLPSATTTEYFKEISTLVQLEKENKALKSGITIVVEQEGDTPQSQIDRQLAELIQQNKLLHQVVKMKDQQLDQQESQLKVQQVELDKLKRDAQSKLRKGGQFIQVSKVKEQRQQSQVKQKWQN